MLAAFGWCLHFDSPPHFSGSQAPDRWFITQDGDADCRVPPLQVFLSELWVERKFLFIYVHFCPSKQGEHSEPMMLKLSNSEPGFVLLINVVS